MNEYFMPIGELTKKLDVPAHTLRYWEKEFPSLISPTAGAGGRRFYRQETVGNIIALKKYLYSDGYTIDGVKKLIASGGFSAAPAEAPRPAPPAFTPTAEMPPAGKEIKVAINLLEQAKKILTDS
ncbi:MAG: MerR family transcriptional regulator [Rickettsiales bacterium]|jgi:DNA-binding transcriptional MerR regulator|nr:MerR family transcriptional regulator [Rickettsiales bacterium]